MARRIKEIAREVGSEVSRGYTETKEYLRKRVRKPKDMRFAVTPQPAPVEPSIGELITGIRVIAPPPPVRRKRKRAKVKYIYVERRR